MKKILLTFSLCISVLVSGDQVSGMDAAAVAEHFTGTNTVYVYRRADGEALSPEQKTRIWEIETTLKFPACVGDSNFERNLALHPGLLENELGVFKQELGAGYCITPCSTSLYQLFILKYFLATVNERSLKQVSTFLCYYREDYTFSPENELACDTKYLQKGKVQQLFWDLNDYIINFFDTYSGTHQEVWSTRQLKTFADKLIDALCSELGHDKNAYLAFDEIFWCETGLNFPSAFLENSDDQLVKYWSAYTRPILLRCLQTEIDTMVDACLVGKYSLYRGESEYCSCITPDIYSVAFSFGDGLFGGIIRDFQSGMPMIFALKTGRLVRVDLDKRNIINGTCPFFMQFVPPLASGLGAGETFHPRMRVSRESVFELSKIAFVISQWEIPAELPFPEDY